MNVDEKDIRRRLKLIDGISEAFGETNIKTLEYHFTNISDEDLWNMLLKKPRKFLEFLDKLFGTREASLNILNQLFSQMIGENMVKHDVLNELIEAIKEDNVKKVSTIINDIIKD